MAFYDQFYRKSFTKIFAGKSRAVEDGKKRFLELCTNVIMYTFFFCKEP